MSDSNKMEYSRKELQDKVRELGPWYQCFNLDGVLTNAADPTYPESRWQLIEPYVPKNLTGKTVLDIGCNAGYFSIKMKQRGAASVLGIDIKLKSINQARFVANYFNVSVDYEVVNLYEFVLTNRRKFDFVLFLGVFYHLRYPLLVVDKIAEMAREKMYFTTVIRGTQPITDDDQNLSWEKRKLTLLDDYEIGETKVFDHPDYPKMFFIEENYNHDYSNWWFANESCVYAMLRSAGFRNIIKSGSEVFVCDPPPPEYANEMERVKGISYLAPRLPLMNK